MRFQMHFLEGKGFILIQISLEFVLEDLIGE